MSVVDEGGTQSGAKGLGRWLARVAPRSARGSVAVAILPDSKVKALNRRFRRVNKGTDVLSFPGTGKYLGDIAISRGIARKQAKLLGHSLTVELRVLALHGLLHLLGYDHESDNGRMARAEARLRRKARLPLGLIARSS
ncbi:MAG TPA: rRNA maturation RNase YbeY [Vicinamibacterales bacterium]|nr:rRNA maturation RNase YbeY [Vicinamibacterales bacterium]